MITILYYRIPEDDEEDVEAENDGGVDKVDHEAKCEM